jgi:hypothetical protein
MDKGNMGELLESKMRKRHKETGEMFVKYYPNLIRKIYAINAPTIAYVIFKAVSWMFSKKNREKFNMLGKDYLKVLDKEYGLENLPKCIGGTNPIPLEEYENFWDKDLMNSYKNKTFGFK